ncbi:MAG: carbon monoxide dehydrogenase [Chloroflexi bacterium]|nr:carbon monoxide dehydrogenase [Chloroflexota bacterium]
MHPYNYYAPENINDALGLLEKFGSKARCLAGGTDILVQTRGGRFELDAIIDVKNIPELTKVEWTKDHLLVGSAVPCYLLYEDEKVTSQFPGIIDAASLIGGIQIQSRASLGGNLCNASPSADGICPLIVHNTICVIAGPKGSREISVDQFCVSPGKNVLDEGEFLVSLKIPLPNSGFGAAYERFIPRNEMDIAVAAVGSSVVVDGGKITNSKIALAAVGPTPIYAEKASEFLLGKDVSEDNLDQASQIAQDSCSPITDMRGDVEFRKHLIGVLTRRTLDLALERAGGN